MVVAAPVVVVIGAALLLILFAYYAFIQRPLAILLGKLPVVGSQVAGVVAAAMGNLLRWTMGVAETALGGLNDLVRAIVGIPLSVMQHTLDVVDLVYGYANAIAIQAGGYVGTLANRIDQAAQGQAASGDRRPRPRSRATWPPSRPAWRMRSGRRSRPRSRPLRRTRGPGSRRPSRPRRRP